jgi:monofunctional biosynthetic peptidoglycan transglycosylase
MSKKQELQFEAKLRMVLFSTVALIIVFLCFTPQVYNLKFNKLTYEPYHKDGKTRWSRTLGPASPEWVKRDNIPLSCRTALLASEDTRFYDHIGIDFTALKDSMIANAKAGRIKLGGSTITQQLVKNSFLSRKKSIIRKLREMSGAVLLNTIMNKDEQMTWYFNIIEFGPEVYGLKQAANYFFNKDVQKLSPSQCIALVSIIPSPIKWGKNLKNHEITSFLKERYEIILRRMRRMKLTPESSIRLASNLSPFGYPWFLPKIEMSTDSVF